MKVAFAYTSEALQNFDDDALENLAVLSSKKNEQVGITGYLYFQGRHFLQYIEGPEDAIDSLMNVLKKDPRHRIGATVQLSNIRKRIFPRWYMRFLSNNFLQTKSKTIEDELRFIVETASTEKSGREEFSSALIQVTQRIATLDC